MQVGWWHVTWLDVSLEVVRTSGLKVARATQTLVRATTQARFIPPSSPYRLRVLCKDLK